MKIIAFSRFSRITFIPLGVTLFTCIRRISLKLIGKTKFSNHLFFVVGILFTSEMFAGIFYAISLCRQNQISFLKEKKKDYHLLINDNSLGAIKLIDYKFAPQNKNKWQYFLLTICVSLLEFCSFFFTTVISMYNPYSSLYFIPFIETIQIILVVLFSKLILNYSFYKHHFLGIIIFIIGIFVYYCNQIKFAFKLEIFLRLLVLSFYSLQDVLEKYILTQSFISPFQLLFYEGSIGIILTFVISLISSYTLGDEYSNIKCLGTIFENFRKIPVEINESKILILYIILLLISSIGYNTFSLLTIYYYTPTYIYVTEDIALFLMIFINLIMNYGSIKFDAYYFISILGGIFLLIGSFIFNEIITLHFCGLNYNTKEEIKNRASIEIVHEGDELLPQNERQFPSINSLVD